MTNYALATEAEHVDLDVSLRRILGLTGCVIVEARNACTGSYYITVQSPDGRRITLRDADHGGDSPSKLYSWSHQIDLTCERRRRFRMAARELLIWAGGYPRELVVHARLDTTAGWHLFLRRTGWLV